MGAKLLGAYVGAYKTRGKTKCPSPYAARVAFAAMGFSATRDEFLLCQGGAQSGHGSIVMHSHARKDRLCCYKDYIDPPLWGSPRFGEPG